MAKVSVIIPVYGVEKYIERCAHSLFSQTMQEGIEFIFVDDCTPDRSIEILREVLEQYPHRKEQTRIVKMPTNSGQAAVRRQGIQLAKGDYIIHCDSDDWVDIRMYEAMYRKAVEENADVVVCDYVETNGKNILKTKKGLISSRKEQCIKDMMYMNISWSLWNKMIKHCLYDQIDEYPKYYMGEDMALALPLMLAATNIEYCPSVCYNYFINLESSSRQQSLNDAIKRYKSVDCNLDIVKRKFSYGIGNSYSKAINFIVFFHKMQLLPYRREEEIKMLIDEDFFKVIPSVIFNKEVALKDQLKACVMIVMRVFHQI